MRGKRAMLSWMIDTSRLGRAVTRLAWSRRLSGHGYAVLVLNYHRIGPSDDTPFDRGCFSATAEQFAAHLDHLQRRCTLIGLDDLEAITDPDCPRPPKRPTLLTFDDGYADNYHLAFPILKAANAPAVFFPTTGFIDRSRVAWWDEIAWLVRRVPGSRLTLPEFAIEVALDGPSWTQTDDNSRRHPRGLAIQHTLEAYKRLPTDQAERLLDRLRELAATEAPVDDLSRLYMTWDQLREMRTAGFDIGGHTMHHPVLARIDEATQRAEITGCRDRLLKELGTAPTAFSYPVGRPGTFTDTTQRLVDEAGFRWAFQFFGGLWRLGHDHRGDESRLAIPRLPVHSQARDHEFRTQLAWPRLFGTS